MRVSISCSVAALLASVGAVCTPAPTHGGPRVVLAVQTGPYWDLGLYLPAVGPCCRDHVFGIIKRQAQALGQQERSRGLMAGPRPHSPADLALAPVLLSIERNLSRLRDSGDVEYSLALELGDEASHYRGATDRAERVRRAATREVDLHGWQVYPTGDMQGLAVERGPHRVSLMLGKRLANYIEWGTAAQSAAFHPWGGYGR
jgi:hypothetical protein